MTHRAQTPSGVLPPGRLPTGQAPGTGRPAEVLWVQAQPKNPESAIYPEEKRGGEVQRVIWITEAAQTELSEEEY